MHSLLWNHLHAAGIETTDHPPSPEQWAQLLTQLSQACTQMDTERRSLARALSSATSEVEELERRSSEESAKRLRLVFERDTAAKEREAAERRQSRERLSHTMAALNRFAGTIAHDFSNVFYVLLTHCELLQDDLDKPEQREAIAELIQTAQQASDLAKALRCYGPARTHKSRTTELNEQLAQLLPKSCQDHTAVQWHLHLTDQPCRVGLPDEHLQVIVEQLVSNACEAMPEGGNLEVTTSHALLDADSAADIGVEPGPYVRLTLTDNGQGMPAAARERAFEPRYGTKTKGRRGGLGLTTVYNLVTGARGGVSLDASEPRGTRVSVWLPEHISMGRPADASPELDRVSLPSRAPRQVAANDVGPVRKSS